MIFHIYQNEECSLHIYKLYWHFLRKEIHVFPVISLMDSLHVINLKTKQLQKKGVRVVMWFEAGILSWQPRFDVHTGKWQKKITDVCL